MAHNSLPTLVAENRFVPTVSPASIAVAKPQGKGFVIVWGKMGLTSPLSENTHSCTEPISPTQSSYTPIHPFFFWFLCKGLTSKFVAW
jgi:hypothetical protein